MKQLPEDSFPLTPDAFRQATNVSRETIERLKTLETLLRRWQKRVNLVAASTLEDIWGRHFLDSAQLISHVPAHFDANREKIAVDIGSGAGFPGLILALLGVQPLHLVESNKRKAVFLSEAIRELNLDAFVHAERADLVAREMASQAGLVTARALAGLVDLLAFAAPMLAEGGVCLFPKGRAWRDELVVAQRAWRFDWEAFDSATERHGKILRIANLRPASLDSK